MKKTNCNLTTLILALLFFLLAILGCRSTNFSNAPSWTKAKVLSDNEDHPSKIISDGQSVFYVTGGTVASQHEGTNNIKRISLKDGNVSVIVKGGDKIPNPSLAVDDKYLYWSDGGSIMRVAKDGSGKGRASETIIPGARNPDEMFVDDENIYWLIWTGEGSAPQPLMFAPKKGGEAKPLTPPQPATSGLSIDREFVYWMTGDGIKRIAKKGGEIAEVYHNRSGQPSLGLMQDANNFYYMQMDSKGHSALMKLKKNGEPTQLAPSIDHTLEFIIDETNVYYFDYVPNTGSFGPDAIRRVAKGGGDSAALDQGNPAWAKYLAIDAKQIYFTDISKVYALAK